MAKKKKFMTMDGNTAAAYTAYAFTDVAGIYPITPSSPMADVTDQWAQAGRKNIFGQTVNVIEMQSEGGASGTVHGSLQAGALTTTYTASQGLLLMIPNMYKIAGELLPCVFHVAARSLATHALSIFGDHADVMATRQTGFALLASSSVQESMDLAAVAHLSTIKGRVPFLHFFDGFRTSHEIQKIEALDYDDLAKLVDRDALKRFRENAMNPVKPVLRGSAQNPDVYFQGREASNPFYNAIIGTVEEYMAEINKLTGRNYQIFNYYGAEDAERVIVAMGSVCETVEEVVDYLNASGEKVGLLQVHLYRPFSNERLLKAIPSTVKKIAVLDRTKEPGAEGEPLYLDVVNAYKSVPNAPAIVGGRYGMGSKDTTPAQIAAVYKHIAGETPKHNFTVGINDDVTNLSIKVGEHINTAGKGTVACRFWGLGSDGTVGANKNSIKIIGDHTDLYAQAYFSYDSKKSGGITISDLRFGSTPIRSPYLINIADFISCSQQSYVDRYDLLAGLKKGGTFLLNTQWTEDELSDMLPGQLKRYIAEKEIKFYIIDAVHIAENLGLGNRTNTVLQSAFFKLSGILPIDEAVKYMKEAIVKSYGKKGDDVVRMNNAAVDAGLDSLKEVKVPEEWKHAEISVTKREATEFVEKIADVVNAQKGDSLPVSAFKCREDGSLPQGTTQYEKRGIAVNVPKWIPENCIQCNQCSYVCPHAVIRPFLLDDKEAEEFKGETLQGMKPYQDYKFRIQISALDCTGCGSCANTCPAKNKALVMEPLADHMDEADNWDYINKNVRRKPNPMKKSMVKGSQFEKPLFEFSGACAGCGETPYVKLVTQLFGDRMMIANATGCSSIYGGSYPSTPYTTNEKGHGPAWANSLFEDNAEYGLGMQLGYEQIKKRNLDSLEEISSKVSEETKNAIDNYMEAKDDGEKTIEVSESLVAALSKVKSDDDNVNRLISDVIENKNFLSKRSQWIIGGDGWAYDIGYGGLDHVLATGHNVNVLVLDTEVYSNTGGQASKATQTGAIAQFAAGGKPMRKKDLGMMAMSYGYVYVAQVAMGANQSQTLKALIEAESYDGPSLVICYSPCINHGIKGGMGISQRREKEAVDCGYWHLYRFDPRLEAEGKNPFQLDSKEPKGDFVSFLMGEVRYNSLYKKYPKEKVDAIFEKAKKDSEFRYNSYLRLSKQD